MSEQKSKVKRYNITVKGREYEIEGKKKNEWLQLGKLNVFTSEELPEDFSISIELNHMPGQRINCFPQRKRDEGYSF